MKFPSTFDILYSIFTRLFFVAGSVLFCNPRPLESLNLYPPVLWRARILHINPLSLGSRASLRPSPTILKAKTTIMMARPGAKESTGFLIKYL